MKTKLLIFLSVISLGMLLSCSNSNEEVQEFNTDSTEQTNLESKAVIFKLGDKILEDYLSLEIPGLKNYKQRILLPFYKNDAIDSNAWLSIPGLNLEKNYKIYYSRFQHSTDESNQNLNLILEEYDSSEPYGKTINLKDIRVIAVEVSALNDAAKENLDIRDYKVVTEYFGLDEN